MNGTNIATIYEGLQSDVNNYSLYSRFLKDNWCNLNESERLNLLQEVADIQAYEYGGRYSVVVSFENMGNHISGYQIGNQIKLNRNMFVNDKLVESYNGRQIEFDLVDSNWQALETVLHEGRHVFQDNAVKGVVPCSKALKDVFAANCFTVTIVDGERASQYMLGENNYALYYLNPTELDAYRISQQKTQQIISGLQILGLEDKSIETYIRNLHNNGYEAKLDRFRNEFDNQNVDKEVENVLVNIYYGKDTCVDKVIEGCVKRDMVDSQKVLDQENRKDVNSMSKQKYIENGYAYTIDDKGTITAEGSVPEQGVKCGSRVTPKGMQPGDQRGHIIAANEGGPNKLFNMTAQDGKLNQGAYKTVENAEVDLAKKGYDVRVSKTAYVSTQQGGRPDAYMINDTITSPDGKTQHIHLSFQNMSPNEQEAYNNEINNLCLSDEFDNPDPLRDSMTVQEYAKLMDETEGYLPSLKEEFDVDNSVEMSFDQNYIVDADMSFDDMKAETNDNEMNNGVDSGCSVEV